jgi:hypothetical protein
MKKNSKKKGKSLHTRECRRHGVLSIDNFYKCNHSEGGYYYRCKLCARQKYLINKKYIAEYSRWYSRRYYKKNKDKILKKARQEYRRKGSKRWEYYMKNKEHYRKISKINYYRNIENNRLRSLRYYYRNRKRLLKQMKKYRERNKRG